MRPRDEFEKKQLKDIGVFFAQLRYKKNHTQRDIGRISGLGQAAVTNFEKSKSDFRFTTLQTMAMALGYRIEVSLVSQDGEERILVEPDPNYPVARVYSNGTVMDRLPRAPRKPRKPKTILPGPQVEYENDDEFDTEKELAALRARLGMS